MLRQNNLVQRMNISMAAVATNKLSWKTPTEGIDFIHEGIKYSFCSDHCKQ